MAATVPSVRASPAFTIPIWADFCRPIESDTWEDLTFMRMSPVIQST